MVGSYCSMWNLVEKLATITILAGVATKRNDVETERKQEKTIFVGYILI